LIPKISFEALEMSYGALELSFEVDLVGSKSGHDWREAGPTIRVGLAGSFMAVGLQWLRESFFGLGISHFDVMWVSSFSFFVLLLN
jgi:hypothetical protein